MLAGTLPAFEMFMSRWEILAEKHEHLKPFIDIGLSWARKYYCKMDQTRAYVVAMGEFLVLLMCCILLYFYLFCSTQSICAHVMDPSTLGTSFH